MIFSTFNVIGLSSIISAGLSANFLSALTFAAVIALSSDQDTMYSFR